tara:strand:+ start:2292 stop:2498 length:207 start_codon:yes stop_codon:yes gene_type:complete
MRRKVMKRYQFDVNIIYEVNEVIDVQAKNEDIAYEKAVEIMENSGYDPTTDEIEEISREIAGSCCLDD